MFNMVLVKHLSVESDNHLVHTEQSSRTDVIKLNNASPRHSPNKQPPSYASDSFHSFCLHQLQRNLLRKKLLLKQVEIRHFTLNVFPLALAQSLCVILTLVASPLAVQTLWHSQIAFLKRYLGHFLPKVILISFFSLSL